MPSSACQTCRSEEHTSELQSHSHLVCRLLLEKKKHKGGGRPRGGRGGARSVALGDDAAHRACGVRCFHCDAPCALVALFLRPPFFFFKDPAPPEIYPLPLHDPLPI